MAARQTLTLFVRVQILHPQPKNSTSFDLSNFFIQAVCLAYHHDAVVYIICPLGCISSFYLKIQIEKIDANGCFRWLSGIRTVVHRFFIADFEGYSFNVCSFSFCESVKNIKKSIDSVTMLCYNIIVTMLRRRCGFNGTGSYFKKRIA